MLDLTGGVGTLVSEGIGMAANLFKAYFPPDMPPEKKAELEMKFKALAAEQARLANEATNEAVETFNKRIAIHEGTAKDLLQMPILGRALLFARGAQRPTWGFATLYFDYVLFVKGEVPDAMMNITAEGIKSMNVETLGLIYMINFLVLGFLFGERTLKNLEPLILKIIAKVFK